MNELPDKFQRWFEGRGWQPRPHQSELLSRAASGEHCLLISPTGGGKTLSGFLPSLIELDRQPEKRGAIHTLYISPLKALAVDIARNLEEPIAEMGLDIRVETRTGDTPHAKRQRQRQNPPDILITTPEQLSLILADAGAKHLLGNLRTVILDELHALVSAKRGVLLSLALGRLQKLAPQLRRVGLSATVAAPDVLCAWLAPDTTTPVSLVIGKAGAEPDLKILHSTAHVPWSGHSARYALPEVYDAIGKARMTLLFVNTRSQAELVFQELWMINDQGLAIALHHGSLDVAQRRKVEAAMAAGQLKAIVCTSTLDLGIDWGDVDLVINIGAPKGSSRLLQRIGRANHRLNEPSRALLVPSNRFEVLECVAALSAVSENAQDTEPPATMKLDVLAQHVLGCACAGPFAADELYAEIIQCWTYRQLDRATFDQVVDFVATGGYALRAYERYARLRLTKEGLWRLSNPKLAQQYRLNMGTIVESEMLKVRLVSAKKGQAQRTLIGGRVLGEIEEYFLSQLVPGDTFIFAGEVLRFEGLDAYGARASRTHAKEPKIPSYAGGRFPLSTYLAGRVRQILSQPELWHNLPQQVQEWLGMQKLKSLIPKANEMLVETFPRNGRHYLVCYPFEGRLALQSLGMLLTRRLERWGAQPLGFLASEYALTIWTVRDLSQLIASGKLSLNALFDEDMLGDDLEAWLADSSLMKRSFRSAAIISGLIEKRWPGKEKTGRQMTVNSDLIYEVLRSHQPDHIVLRAAWEDAAAGLIDIHRLGALLKRITGQIVHKALPSVSPLAVPVLLEIGQESIYGEGHDALLAEAADTFLAESGQDA